MHAELDDLVARTVKLAKRKLRETDDVPVFASVLDSLAKPSLLQPEYEEGAEPIRMSVGGHVELLREMIRQSETSGATICAPVIVRADDGTTWDGFEVLADHAFDQHAYSLVVRYVRVEDEYQFELGVLVETDDFLVAR